MAFKVGSFISAIVLTFAISLLINFVLKYTFKEKSSRIMKVLVNFVSGLLLTSIFFVLNKQYSLQYLAASTLLSVNYSFHLIRWKTRKLCECGQKLNLKAKFCSACGSEIHILSADPGNLGGNKRQIKQSVIISSLIAIIIATLPIFDYIEYSKQENYFIRSNGTISNDLVGKEIASTPINFDIDIKELQRLAKQSQENPQPIQYAPVNSVTTAPRPNKLTSKNRMVYNQIGNTLSGLFKGITLQSKRKSYLSHYDEYTLEDLAVGETVDDYGSYISNGKIYFSKGYNSKFIQIGQSITFNDEKLYAFTEFPNTIDAKRIDVCIYRMNGKKKTYSKYASATRDVYKEWDKLYIPLKVKDLGKYLILIQIHKQRIAFGTFERVD
jgi:hypothetical protein